MMVYMGADNGMSEQAYSDLAEMKGVGSTAEVNIIVQMDNPDRDSLPGAKRYFVEKGKARLLDNLGKLDMADPQTLIDFAGFVSRTYPAKNYFLILWDHGNGWPEGMAAQSSMRSIIDDESSGNIMGVAGGELGRAIAGSREVLGKKIAVVGFDACLMSMIEVGCEIQPGAQIMLGSEGLVPYQGLPYGEVLKILVNNPALSPRELARQIVTTFVNFYDDLDCTFSAVDLNELTRALVPLGQMLETLIPDARNNITKTAREKVQTFPFNAGTNPSPTDEYIDLMDWIEMVDDMPAVESQARACLDHLRKSVIEVAGSGSSLTRAKGISIWLPYYWLSFKHQYSSYKKLSFADAVPWLKFLNAFCGSDDIAPTPPEFVKTIMKGGNSYRIFWLKSSDLSDVEYELRELQGVKEVLFDPADSPGNWSTNGFALSGSYAHSGDSSFFSGSADNLDNTLTLKRPMALAHGGLVAFFALYKIEEGYNGKHDVFYVEISFDGISWSAVDSLYGDSLVWAEHRYFLEPAESVYLRFRYTTDGSQNWTGAFIDDIKIYSFGEMRTVARNSRDTSFNFFNKPRGDYCYGVFGIDAAGNRSSVSQFYELTASDYALPFSVPSPFVDSCQIVCDFPDGNQPQVYIYTINGEFIRKFPFSAIINKRLAWDGKNEKGKAAASGIYLVLVKEGNFSRLGKIARVR
jgi:hypothetical protein